MIGASFADSGVVAAMRMMPQAASHHARAATVDPVDGPSHYPPPVILGARNNRGGVPTKLEPSRQECWSGAHERRLELARRALVACGSTRGTLRNPWTSIRMQTETGGVG